MHATTWTKELNHLSNVHGLLVLASKGSIFSPQLSNYDSRCTCKIVRNSHNIPRMVHCIVLISCKKACAKNLWCSFALWWKTFGCYKCNMFNVLHLVFNKSSHQFDKIQRRCLEVHNESFKLIPAIKMITKGPNPRISNTCW